MLRRQTIIVAGIEFRVLYGSRFEAVTVWVVEDGEETRLGDTLSAGAVLQMMSAYAQQMAVTA